MSSRSGWLVLVAVPVIIRGLVQSASTSRAERDGNLLIYRAKNVKRLFFVCMIFFAALAIGLYLNGERGWPDIAFLIFAFLPLLAWPHDIILSAESITQRNLLRRDKTIALPDVESLMIIEKQGIKDRYVEVTAKDGRKIGVTEYHGNLVDFEREIMNRMPHGITTDFKRNHKRGG